MLFKITGKHLEITDQVKEYAREKTSKLPKYYSNITQVEVIIDGSKKGDFTVEIIARGEHSNIFVITETGSDITQCISSAVHKIERQLTKKKTKERNHKHIA